MASERVSAGQGGRCGVARTRQFSSAQYALPAIRDAGVRAAHGSFSPTARYRTQNHSDREKSEHSSINSGLMGVHFHLHFYGLSVSTSTSAARPCAGVQVAHGNFSPTARYRTQNHSDREKSEPSSINRVRRGVHFTLHFLRIPPLLSPSESVSARPHLLPTQRRASPASQWVWWPTSCPRSGSPQTVRGRRAHYSRSPATFIRLFPQHFVRPVHALLVGGVFPGLGIVVKMYPTKRK